MSFLTQVHTEEHDPRSTAFQRTSFALISATTQAVAINQADSSAAGFGREQPEDTAAGSTSLQAACRPVVSATCVAGCIQLVAAINAPRSAASAAAGGMGPGKLSAATSQLQDVLEQQVRSSLQALNPDAQVPLVGVQVMPEGQGVTASSTHAASCSTDSIATAAACEEHGLPAASAGADVSGQLLCCSPPCLAVGAVSTELQLLVEVSGPSATRPCNTEAALGPSAPADSAVIPGRLIVWDANQVVLLDTSQDLTMGTNVCK